MKTVHSEPQSASSSHGWLIATRRAGTGALAWGIGEKIDVTFLRHVVAHGYASYLDSTEMQKIGKDPFLVA
ncbi:hypothetical protein EQ718_07875 [Paracoccus versutus]|uniref:Uncharacterized protein n=1 Tax=Paracoccus versutus TaxID=34007 RepID=A0AAQ0HKP4_PARVE|nr:hypothetical protein [Paracoccus versutus]REG52541.1 hypothetical protein ATH84_1008118 [Paracoccus versutus]WEJ78800.1 hypothetical protein EQ718_07875 [Paracoccus versutus]